MSNGIQLSFTSLSILKDCPRCFWLDRNSKISRPRGIFSSLQNGIDGLLKTKLEIHRGSLPEVLCIPELEGFTLYDGDDLKQMRHWKSNPCKMEDSYGNCIVGSFDDLLYHPDEDTYAFLDYKTKGSEPDQAYVEKYYQTQLDIYTNFLLRSGRKIASFGVFLYFWPVESVSGLIEFKAKPFLLTPNTKAADELFLQAVTVLKGECPEPSKNCEYCKYVNKRGA